MRDETCPESMTRLAWAIRNTSVELRNEKLRALGLDLDELDRRDAETLDEIHRAWDQRVLLNASTASRRDLVEAAPRSDSPWGRAACGPAAEQTGAATRSERSAA